VILSAWLDQPVWLIFTLLGAGFAVVAGLLWLVSNLRPTRPLLHRLGLGIVAPYFNAISVMLALLTGFVANDAWERQRQASRIVQSERTNLLAAHDLSLATASDMSGIRKRLLAYAEALIDDEWPRMTEGASSNAAGEALGALMQAVADPRHTAEHPLTWHRSLGMSAR
jgi:hypothetical protein